MKHELEIRDPKRYQRWIAWDDHTCHGCPKYGAATATGKVDSGHTYHIHDTQPKAMVVGSEPTALVNMTYDGSCLPEDAPKVSFIRSASDMEIFGLLTNWHPGYEVLGPFPKKLFDGGQILWSIPARARIVKGKGTVGQKPAKQLMLKEFEIETDAKGDQGETLRFWVYGSNWRTVQAFVTEKCGLSVPDRSDEASVN